MRARPVALLQPRSWLRLAHRLPRQQTTSSTHPVCCKFHYTPFGGGVHEQPTCILSTQQHSPPSIRARSRREPMYPAVHFYCLLAALQHPAGCITSPYRAPLRCSVLTTPATLAAILRVAHIREHCQCSQRPGPVVAPHLDTRSIILSARVDHAPFSDLAIAT